MIAAGAQRRRLLNRTQTGTLLRALFMALYVLVTVFPFYWMFLSTFKTNSDLYNLQNNPLWFNELPTLEHIEYLFSKTLFGRWMLNSLIIGVAEQMGFVYAPTYSIVLTFLIMAAVLAFRPQGLLGTGR